MFAIEDQGLILDAALEPPERRIAYFTSLCVLRSGTVVCGYQNGPQKHAPTSTIRLSRSDDGGRNWRQLPCEFETHVGGVPGSLAAAELVEVGPASGLERASRISGRPRWLLFATWFDRSDPAQPLFDPATEGILRSKQLLAVSDNEGQTWSAWRELDMGDLRGCALTGPVVQWRDGPLAFAFESFKEFDDPRPGRHAAWLMISRDKGETFSPPLLVAQHPEHQVYYWDQRLCPAADGQFVAMFWTHDLAGRRDLNVHLRRGRIAGDRIATSEMLATTITGQIAAPCLLPDGRLLAFVVDRSRPATMTLWCSTDEGRSWPAAHRLIVYRHDERAALSQGRDNIDFRQYWEDMGRWSFGHPAIRWLDEHRVLLAWYAGTPDCMSLHWARVRIDGGSPR